MVSDNVKFPSGMKALGDYIHSKGLKYGLYTSRGNVQCGTSQYSAPGSFGYYKQDVDLMVSWGMDYLKVDSCGGSQDHNTAFAEYGQIRDLLNATKRPVFYSLCGWSDWYSPVGWSLGNSWRMHGDGNNWHDHLDTLNVNADLAKYARPGGWNDPDLLSSDGKGSSGPDRGGWYQTDLQSRSQFSLWSVMTAPLLISADITGVSPYALETYSNAEVIAINQNRGRFPDFPYQGTRLAGGNLTDNKGTNIWGKALDDGSFAVVFLNNFPQVMNITCDQACFEQMKFKPGVQLTVRDLWQHKDIDNIAPGTYTATGVQGGGGCVTLKFTPK